MENQDDYKNLFDRAMAVIEKYTKLNNNLIEKVEKLQDQNEAYKKLINTLVLEIGHVVNFSPNSSNN